MQEKPGLPLNQADPHCLNRAQLKKKEKKKEYEDFHPLLPLPPLLVQQPLKMRLFKYFGSLWAPASPHFAQALPHRTARSRIMQVYNLEQTASPNGRNSKLQMTVTAISFLFPKTQRKTGEKGGGGGTTHYISTEPDDGLPQEGRDLSNWTPLWWNRNWMPDFCKHICKLLSSSMLLWFLVGRLVSGLRGVCSASCLLINGKGSSTTPLPQAFTQSLLHVLLTLNAAQSTTKSKSYLSKFITKCSLSHTACFIIFSMKLFYLCFQNVNWTDRLHVAMAKSKHPTKQKIFLFFPCTYVYKR